MSWVVTEENVGGSQLLWEFNSHSQSSKSSGSLYEIHYIVKSCIMSQNITAFSAFVLMVKLWTVSRTPYLGFKIDKRLGG